LHKFIPFVQEAVTFSTAIPYSLQVSQNGHRDRSRKKRRLTMKRSAIAKTLAIAAVTALAMGIAPTAKAQVNKGCNNATLQGTFAYTSTGSFVAAPAPLGLYADTGAQTFDGNGGTAVSGMSNTNGSAGSVNNTGTYTVNSDCTGTFTLQIAPGIAAHYFFVIANNGSTFQAVCLDPVAVITRIGTRLYPGRAI
jgi:hypothetical protein